MSEKAKSTTAKSETTMKEKNATANRMAQLVADNSQSIDRMSIMAALLNVFNLAILKQAGRPQWDATDAYLFSTALSAVDQIGEYDISQTRNTVSHTDVNVEDELAELTSNIRSKGSNGRGFVEDERLPQVVNN